MLTLLPKESDNLNVAEAIERMQKHACQTKMTFANDLKVKSPNATYGRLAGSDKYTADVK